MTKKRLWLVMLAMVLVFGMTVVGCDGDDDGGGKTAPHKITITELGGKSGTVQIYLLSSISENIAAGAVAGAQGTISGNSVTASFQKVGGGAWTESGSYIILMAIGSGEDQKQYFYTNGQTLEQLGISDANDFNSKLPKCPITGPTTSIRFDKFVDVTGM